MGGKVEVHSELGKGSTFTITVAIAEAGAQVEQQDEFVFETITGYEGERRSILVVDDYAPNRGVVKGLLAPLGFEIWEAEHGEAALQIAPEKQPSFILMDIAMPGIDGCETTRRLRRVDSLANVPIVACSASLSAARREETRQAGCNDFLAKPVDARRMLEILQRFLKVQWTRKTGDAAGLVKERRPTEVVLPDAALLKQLLQLANDGLLQDIVSVCDREETENPRLGPWLATIRQLAYDCEVDNLCARLEADSGASAN